MGQRFGGALVGRLDDARPLKKLDDRRCCSATISRGTIRICGGVSNFRNSFLGRRVRAQSGNVARGDRMIGDEKYVSPWWFSSRRDNGRRRLNIRDSYI